MRMRIARNNPNMCMYMNRKGAHWIGHVKKYMQIHISLRQAGTPSSVGERITPAREPFRGHRIPPRPHLASPMTQPSNDLPSNDLPSDDLPFRERLLGYLLLRASYTVSAGFSEALKRHGLSVRQWRVLGSLWDAESLTLGELAEAILCEQSSTTRLVDRLIAAGLVEKRVAAQDRRKVHVRLTEKGRKESTELVDMALAVEREVADTYGHDNTEALRTELQALIERFVSGEGAPGGK